MLEPLRDHPLASRAVPDCFTSSQQPSLEHLFITAASRIDQIGDRRPRPVGSAADTMVLMRVMALAYMGDPYMTAPGTDYGPYAGPPMPHETIYPDHTSWGLVSH